MNKEELQKNIEEYFGKLPEDIQEELSSMRWLEALKKISIRYSLTEKQIEALSTETTLALLGTVHLEEYEQILTNELGLREDILKNLLAEINDEIFRDIAPKLTETFHKNNEPQKEEISVMTPELEKKLAPLPEYVKDAVNKSNYGEMLYEIAKGKSLSITDIGELEKITTNLIDGILSPDNFKSTIKETLRLDDTKAESIVNEINEKILKNIRQNMMAVSAPVVKKEVPTPIENKGGDILKEAGIEILQNTPELKSGIISENKLAEPFKIPKTVTEYSLSNISKNPQEETRSKNAPLPQNIPKVETPKPPTSYDKQDPYRMPVE